MIRLRYILLGAVILVFWSETSPGIEAKRAGVLVGFHLPVAEVRP